MAIIATAGETFIPAPEGLHQGVCVDVVDMGNLEVTYAGKTKQQHKIRVIWQIAEMMDDGRRFTVQKRYTLSLRDTATLKKDLESWRGRSFTVDELKGFDVERLIGANAQLNVQHASKNGQTYANVMGIVPLARGMSKMEPTAYVRVKDRPKDGEPDVDSPLTDEDIPF